MSAHEALVQLALVLLTMRQSCCRRRQLVTFESMLRCCQRFDAMAQLRRLQRVRVTQQDVQLQSFQCCSQ